MPLTTHDLAAAVLDALAARGQTLATAESLTAGMVASTLAEVPGASRVLLGGVVAYASEVKVGVLGVPAQVVREHGVVSAACAAAMARGAAALTGSDWGISTTGVAGPATSEGHPAGTVHVAVHGPGVGESALLSLPGDRAAVRSGSVHAVLGLLWDILGREETSLG